MVLENQSQGFMLVQKICPSPQLYLYDSFFFILILLKLGMEEGGTFLTIEGRNGSLENVNEQRFIKTFLGHITNSLVSWINQKLKRKKELL